ncbi:MAG: sigma-70 family RNA polymerase sigma factor [bacterium]|nr:sigma-70 family RNA polymerase sigma factor [bacterium]
MDFEAAVDRHQRKVYTFARYYLGNGEEAEDITQETLLKLWQRRDQVDPEGTRAWLLQVARNACLDRLRRRQSAAKLFAVDPEGEAAEQAPDAKPGPQARAEASDFRQHLRLALEQLADPMRSIVILREVQGLKYQEICEVLDVPLTTVRVYLHRGRRRLREQLRDVYGDAARA